MQLTLGEDTSAEIDVGDYIMGIINQTVNCGDESQIRWADNLPNLPPASQEIEAILNEALAELSALDEARKLFDEDPDIEIIRQRLQEWGIDTSAVKELIMLQAKRIPPPDR